MQLSFRPLLPSFIIAMTTVVLGGCSKKDSTIVSPAPDQPYTISAIRYTNADPLEVDSAYQVLDTATYYNRTNTTQPEHQFAPYAGLQDSIFIQLKDPDQSLTGINIREGIYLPSIISDHDVFYSSDDSVYVDHFPDSFTMPLVRRKQTTIGVIPLPRTWYQVTADYYRIRFSIPFTARLTGLNDGTIKEVTGIVFGSLVSTATRNAGSHRLKGIYLAARPLDE